MLQFNNKTLYILHYLVSITTKLSRRPQVVAYKYHDANILKKPSYYKSKRGILSYYIIPGSHKHLSLLPTWLGSNHMSKLAFSL